RIGLRPAASSRVALITGGPACRYRRACWKQHLVMRCVAISMTPISRIVPTWTRCGIVVGISSRLLGSLQKRGQTHECPSASPVGAACDEVFPPADTLVPADGLQKGRG